MNAGKTVTAAELLGLSDEVTDEVPALNCPLHLLPSKGFAWWDVKMLQHRSNDNLDAFVKELKAVKVSKEAPVALLRGAKLDSFDHMLVVWDSSVPGDCRYIATDCKSKQESLNVLENEEMKNKMVNKNKEVTFPGNGKQAKAFCDAMNSALPEGAPPVTYVYITNYQQQQYVQEYEKGAQWVYAGRQELERFMGPMWDVHRTCREGFQPPPPLPKQ